ncbi:hypothetical protein [Streptomyces sp. NPDC051286]|uniref:hypothetical protein n=1 Tax=Streptomyces sp. NPDC051286 TaxID=3365647 RepID=UPI0037987C03
MTTAPDLETRVLDFIRNNRREDGGIYLSRVVGGFNVEVETAEIEAALTRLHDQGRIQRVGREKTMQRIFLADWR